MSTFKPLGYYEKPAVKESSRVFLDDVIAPKISYSPLYKFRPYTGMEIRPNCDFNG